ncbi:PD-(D/E)XK nuclease family protein [Thioalkalivibrio sp. ALE19]|uniref:PD-(D/E)XK nuclease family protein n=1 Tax=Thioalkalivibrio sp. ALE19 TaxID=1266909 RepID=UPI000403DEFD|nr:PD-(D/E)XK nuclease family protein [Thioalkalivibrio sp. ALE19]
MGLEFWIGAVLMAAMVLAALVALYFDVGGTPKQPLPEVGGDKLLYQDTQNAPTLINREWSVGARPDYIVQEGPDVVLVEQKKRTKGPFLSDLVQAWAGALAARGEGYPVNRVRFVLGGEVTTEDIPQSNADLFNQFRSNYEQARAVREKRWVRFTPKAHKCRSCSYRENCERKVEGVQ